MMKVIEYVKCGKLKISLEELHNLCVKAQSDAAKLIEEDSAEEVAISEDGNQNAKEN